MALVVSVKRYKLAVALKLFALSRLVSSGSSCRHWNDDKR